MKFLFLFILLLSAGCGIQAEAPASASEGSSPDGNAGDPDNPDNSVGSAVYIREVNTNHMGTIVHCRLNPDLPFDSSIPVFIEFEGIRVETKAFPSVNANVPFARFNPPYDGNIVCVIEYVGAEFESEPIFIESQ